MLTLKSLSTKI